MVVSGGDGKLCHCPIDCRSIVVQISHISYNSKTFRLHHDRLMDQCDQLSPLQSWGPELRNFVKLPHRPIDNNDCDVIVEKPTFILKIDASKIYNLLGREIECYKKTIQK